MELIKSLDFIKKVESDKDSSKEEILQGIKQAVKELNLIKAGKLKAKPIKNLLDEL